MVNLGIRVVIFWRKSEYCEKSCASVIKHHAKHKITQEMPENLGNCTKKRDGHFNFWHFPQIVVHQRARRENRKLKFKGQKVKIDWGSTLSNWTHVHYFSPAVIGAKHNLVTELMIRPLRTCLQKPYDGCCSRGGRDGGSPRGGGGSDAETNIKLQWPC